MFELVESTEVQCGRAYAYLNVCSIMSCDAMHHCGAMPPAQIPSTLQALSALPHRHPERASFIFPAYRVLPLKTLIGRPTRL
jgi:hypothetical protein